MDISEAASNDSAKKRKVSSPAPDSQKTAGMKKKTSEEKKSGFDRGLEPEKIIGKKINYFYKKLFFKNINKLRCD